MNLSQRTKLSLCQFLIDVQGRDEIVLLLQKHGISTDDFEFGYPGRIPLDAIKAVVLAAEHVQAGDLVQELARTCGAIRSSVSPRYKYDERWDDLCSCLQLDGYARGKDEHGRELGSFCAIEPELPGASNPEDDLRRELGQSALAGADKIISTLDKSADAFRREDFNGCLNNARVALQTLGTAIALQIPADLPSGFNDEKWGQVLDRLRSTGFLDEKQEKGLAGVYGFVSPGSHRPIGFTEQEFARLGRTLALNLCHFLVKLWNAREG